MRLHLCREILMRSIIPGRSDYIFFNRRLNVLASTFSKFALDKWYTRRPIVQDDAKYDAEIFSPCSYVSVSECIVAGRSTGVEIVTGEI